MTEPWGTLHFDVRHGQILIFLPGTTYTVTYYKPSSSGQLLAKNFSLDDDPRIGLTCAEFLARAWKLANGKARELGWINSSLPSATRN